MTHANVLSHLHCGKLLYALLLFSLSGNGWTAQSLEQAADDPTASLMSLQLQDGYTSSFHNLPDKSANTVLLRSAIPFKLANTNHIMRISAPIITDSPVQDNGLSDITIFDLVTFNQTWGRWGVGLVALLPTGGKSRGAEKWGLGPAIGFTARDDKLLWGLFNQNILTVAGEDSRADVNVSIVQPILNYSLGNGLAVGVSEMTATYDWETNRWSSLPLGVRVSRLHRFGKLPVQFSLQYEHDFADDAPASPKNSFRFVAKFLFPTIL